MTKISRMPIGVRDIFVVNLIIKVIFPLYVWTKEHIEAHFLTCFVALTIARILENKLERKYSIGTILESLSKAKCNLIQQNYYLFDYYDEVLKDIERVTDIDFGKRIRTLGEIKKVLAKTQK